MVRCAERIPLQNSDAFERQQRRDNSEHAAIWRLLDDVCDPEIPVLSLWELGVLQDVSQQQQTIVVRISPTYSGCPAMAVMSQDIESALHRAGYPRVRVERNLAPVWGTHFLTDAAKAKLRAFQIAAPGALRCPNCDSDEVELVSEFSSTACKALYRCATCREPFDYFKPH